MGNIINGLRELNFYALEQGLESLKKSAYEMATRAGTKESGPAFEAFPSLIPLAAPVKKHERVLSIDIGGTSTKAGLRRCDGTQEVLPEWELLFEVKNSEFRQQHADQNSFVAFCRALGDRIRDHLTKDAKLSDDALACGVVWSNALKNDFFEKAGITGIVTQRELYQKGEWFIAELENGTDLGRCIVDAFKESGLQLSHIVISNDTPLTMKAHPSAHAGMVASTGLNATLVKTAALLGIGGADTEVICNGELGGRFYLESALVSRADVKPESAERFTIELLTSGRFLPDLFVSHIRALAKGGIEELRPIASYIDRFSDPADPAFRPHDMSLLLSNQVEFLKRRQDPKAFRVEALHALATLAEEIFARSGKLCSLIAYGSVANQFDYRDELTVALDSRLAREVPVFWDAMQATTKALTPPEHSIALELIFPLETSSGKISVPMQGAANALDCFL